MHALPDGQLRLDTSVAAQRTRVSGEWSEIDTSLTETAEGVAPVAPAVAMVFADGKPGQPLVTMERDGHELTFDVPFELGEPVVYASTLEYRDVLDGVDLIVTVNQDGTGFSEVLRIDSPQAATDPRIATLTFPLSVSDGLEVEEANGGFVATDAEGEVVFTSPPPAMWDSRADRSAPSLTPRLTGLSSGTTGGVSVTNEVVIANRAARVEAPLQDDAAAVMDVAVDAGALVVTPDAGMLDDPATVWPVYIDPSVSGSLSGYISVRNDGWSDWNYSGDQGVGRCGTTGSPMYCSKVFTRRAAWQFTGLQAVGNVDPGDVSSATLSVYGTHSYSCTPAPVEAWWTGGISSGTTWSNLSWAAGLSSQNVAHKSSCGNQRWIEFSVTGGAQQTAAQNAAQLTLGLKAADESSSAGWKRYRWDAQLSITYNRRPSTPTNPYMTNTASGASLGCGTDASPTYVNTATPYLWATMSDLDGGNVMAWFDLFQGSSLVWDGGQTPGQPSGQRHGVQIPAGKVTEGVKYAWNAFAFDGSVHSLNGVACAFILDATPPLTPTIAAVPGGSALYVEDATSGAPQATGRFQFSSPSTDLLRYEYSFGAPTYGLTASPANPVIEYAPPSAGWYTLFVRAVDRAQNVATATYDFGVAGPGTSVWLIEQPNAGQDLGTGGAQRLLTTQGGPTWVDGPMAEDGQAQDWALEFDGIGDGLAATAPATVAGRSFTISALVRTTGDAATRAAVSENGAQGLGFWLGQSNDTAVCPNGTAPCWAFTMPLKDGGSAVATEGTQPLAAGEWVQLTGVYDAAAGTAKLHVCPVWMDRTAGNAVSAWSGRLGSSSLRVGSPAPTTPAAPWLGSIAEVRFYDTALTGTGGEDEIQRTCRNPSQAP